MADPKEEDKQLAASPEMNQFFRALAILNANALHRVNREEGADAKIARAALETARLVTEANQAGNHKCPKGFIWDEPLRRCVPNG